MKLRFPFFPKSKSFEQKELSKGWKHTRLLLVTHALSDRSHGNSYHVCVYISNIYIYRIISYHIIPYHIISYHIYKYINNYIYTHTSEFHRSTFIHLHSLFTWYMWYITSSCRAKEKQTKPRPQASHSDGGSTSDDTHIWVGWTSTTSTTTSYVGVFIGFWWFLQKARAKWSISIHMFSSRRGFSSKLQARIGSLPLNCCLSGGQIGLCLCSKDALGSMCWWGPSC
jgi:hypothetical protein